MSRMPEQDWAAVPQNRSDGLAQVLTPRPLPLR